jgi:competence ComEA-like helix-hairpin-helix protein
MALTEQQSDGSARGRSDGARGGGPTLASGVAALSALAAVLVVGRLVYAQLAPATERAPERCCAAPVEIVDDGATRLGCAGEPALAACTGAVAGDRLYVETGSCRRDVGGMRAAVRLLAGLKLDLNRVSAQELELLDGVGPSLAAAIVAAREARGPFAKLEELRDVQGVGDVNYATLSAHLAVGRQGEAP